MKIRHFQLPWFMSNALRSRLPGFFFFALIVPAAGRLSTTNFYWQSRVSVSLSVTCYNIWLLINATNEWMNKWMKKWKLRRISFKPMFLLSLLTNKDWYNTQIIHCVNDTIFRKRFRVPGFGTGSGTLEPVPWNRLLRQITSTNWNNRRLKTRRLHPLLCYSQGRWR